MKRQNVMWVAWPAFLVAGLLEMLVFALVDPQDIQWFGETVQISRQGFYTLAFFVFWCVTMLASGLTLYLSLPSEVGNTVGDEREKT